MKKIILVFITLILLQGCGIGYKRVIFGTNSNIGVDLDSEPPSTEVSIRRQEYVIEPVFENGKTLPVEASFKARSNGLTNFFYGVDSSFTTGEAAIGMSALYNTGDAILIPSNATGVSALDDFSESYIISKSTPDNGLKRFPGLSLDHQPRRRKLFSKDLEPVVLLESGVVEPLYFTTDSTLGLTVKWSSLSGAPSAFKLGYNRKEIALAPVSMVQKKDPACTDRDEANDYNCYLVNIPSVLATNESGIRLGAGRQDVKWLQYFATGDAATTLTLRKGVREAMLKNSNPDFSLEEIWDKVTAKQNLIASTIKICYQDVAFTELLNVWIDAQAKKLVPTDFLSHALPVYNQVMNDTGFADDAARRKAGNIQFYSNKYQGVTGIFNSNDNMQRMDMLLAHAGYVCGLATR